MTQLDLLAELPAPMPDTLEAAASRASAYLDALLSRRCCRDCGAGVDERALLFVHVAPRRGDYQVRRLAALGVDRARLQAELEKCAVSCRRCLLARTVPKMLRGPARRLGRGSGETAKPGIQSRDWRISA
jgi:hypothetical protein